STPQSTPTNQLTARLLLDAMGHFSPIARQARQGQKPDSICLVVGSCAEGFTENETGDLFVSFTPIRNHCQYFWEAFPARDGRTTYLFTYIDTQRVDTQRADTQSADLPGRSPCRPSLTDLMEEYWQLLPAYQQVELTNLHVKRALFGLLPSYRNSPLAPRWPRILQVGDSSGNQSPLSFGGFGAMLRHLQRLTDGLNDALQQDYLDRDALKLLQPYQPNIAVTWLFQRTMQVDLQQTPEPDQVNRLLAQIFAVMVDAGDAVLKPFLQDVVQFPALAETMFKAGLAHPGTIANVIPQVGLPLLADWSRHYINLGAYTALNAIAQPLAGVTRQLPPRAQYYYQRLQDAWRYGSGQDYEQESVSR
ncbi:MAG: FAD-binding oxidoreductase, partial [Cyanobacteria bacterium P01_H01_bin.121]